MVGPVLQLELLLGSRRSRLTTFRRVLAAWLLLQFGALLLLHFALPDGERGADIGPFVERAFYLLLAEQFLLLALAAPAFAASAIADEKAKGTLALLLTTDLTPGQIVIGKLLGRLAPVAMLTVLSLPLFAFVVGYGQLSLTVVAAVFAVTVAFAFALAATSLYASLRSRQTRDAVLRVYFWWGLAALAGWVYLNWGYPLLLRFPAGREYREPLTQVADFLRCLTPLHVLAPVWGDGDLGEFVRRLGVMVLTYGGLGTVCLALTVRRLRAVTVRQVEGVIDRDRKGPRRAPVSEDVPIYWRERVAGNRLARRLGVIVTAVVTTLASYGFWALAWEEEWFLAQGAVAAALFSFIAGVRASGAVSGERERQTWESLLLTPMDSWELLVDKHEGIMARLHPHLLAHGLPALGFALATGRLAPYYAGAMVVLTWAATRYMAATGISCSVKARDSWRSLAATFAVGYGYWFGVTSVFGIAYFWLGCTIVPVLVVVLAILGIRDLSLALLVSICLTTCGGVAWFLWKSGQARIAQARVWVDQHERYGRTLVRSLTRALRKHDERMAERRKQRQQALSATS
jgi:ABC-type transport system involved in multi-copper enzyme maturation permease subunit